MRAILAVVLLAACMPPLDPNYPGGAPAEPVYPGRRPPADVPPPPPEDPGEFGASDYQHEEFRFQGGDVEVELRRAGSRVLAVARNRYLVPVMMSYTVGNLENATAVSPQPAGAVLLPAAAKPNGRGPAVLLAELAIVDKQQPYHADIGPNHYRFGDPRARAQPYAYRLPYKRGLSFSVLQGFHGAFSHRGSNEFAVDFQCPVATGVQAAREGTVVAANAAAQGSGTTAAFMEYDHVNFVMVLHDDGTLGEYMHLAPSGVLVRPGQRVARGADLALSGNTGYSSTPHLHFQVMTAAEDGIAAHSFAFRVAATPERNVDPVQGDAYLAWE